jgi:hypothetical protein
LKSLPVFLIEPPAYREAGLLRPVGLPFWLGLQYYTGIQFKKSYLNMINISIIVMIGDLGWRVSIVCFLQE